MSHKHNDTAHVSKESAGNGYLVCPDCAPKAGNFATVHPAIFIGKAIKMAFEAYHPNSGKQTKEHMWVDIKSIEGNELIGILANDPFFICKVKLGDTIKLTVNDIEDVAF